MMKKEELRAALHRVQPDEALIRRTLNEIRRQRASKPNRRPSFASGYRLVGAACALLLVVGIGSMVTDFSHAPSSGAPEARARSGNPVTASAESASPGATSEIVSGQTGSSNEDAVNLAVDELLAAASQLQSEWMLLQGSLQNIYLRSASDGSSVCAVSIHVAKVWETGETIGADVPVQDEDILAEICFTDHAEMERFAASMGSEICFIWIRGESGTETPKIAAYQLCE